MFGTITPFSSPAQVIPEIVRHLASFGSDYQIHHLSNGLWNWNLTESSMIEKMQCLLDYTSFTPSFDANDCRAKANIFISKPCTAAVMNDIDESFDIHQHKYQIESVLPVWLPDYNAFVGLIFSFDKEAGIIISGVNLDLVDLKNKARLVGPVSADSWLNNRQIAINRLKLAHGPWYTQDMPSFPSSRYVSSGWSSMGYTPSPSPPSPNYSVSSQKSNVAYCSQTNQMFQNYQNNRGQSV